MKSNNLSNSKLRECPLILGRLCFLIVNNALEFLHSCYAETPPQTRGTTSPMNAVPRLNSIHANCNSGGFIRRIADTDADLP